MLTEFQFPKTRITKKAFVQKFMQVAGDRDCYVSPYSENSLDDDCNPIIVKMSLYYIEGAHAATWCKGHGWIFSNTNIEKNIREIQMLDAAA